MGLTSRLRTRTATTVLAVCTTALLAAGCGGGDGDGDKTVTVTTPSATVPQEVRDAIAIDEVKSDALSKDELESAYEEAVAKALGETASSGGAPPVAAIGPLMAAAPCCSATNLQEATPDQVLDIVRNATVDVTSRFQEEANPGAPCCSMTVKYGEGLDSEVKVEVKFADQSSAAECCSLVSPQASTPSRPYTQTYTYTAPTHTNTYTAPYEGDEEESPPQNGNSNEP